MNAEREITEIDYLRALADTRIEYAPVGPAGTSESQASDEGTRRAETLSCKPRAGGEPMSADLDLEAQDGADDAHRFTLPELKAIAPVYGIDMEGKNFGELRAEIATRRAAWLRPQARSVTLTPFDEWESLERVRAERDALAASDDKKRTLLLSMDTMVRKLERERDAYEPHSRTWSKHLTNAPGTTQKPSQPMTSLPRVLWRLGKDRNR